MATTSGPGVSGTFKVRHRRGTCGNPRTGEPVEVSPRVESAFEPSSCLSIRVDQRCGASGTDKALRGRCVVGLGTAFPPARTPLGSQASKQASQPTRR
ncbi:HU family DNA-binding protein [Candidatus Palauibacter sp.]|uniref:HU family DNA-binding protein n=1 Tax=Candidatus Palauibacter sp. TaxID=3101350 RepID=UPI003B521BB1